LSGLVIIERSAKVEEQLIEDLLDISRIKSGKLSLEMKIVDLVQIVKLAIRSE
jgi:two-component system CheB/CheR fusion protein